MHDKVVKSWIMHAGSATISSTGNNGVSGTGASGSGASADQGRSQATNGASIAPAPAPAM